jgi:hypothetical protein
MNKRETGRALLDAIQQGEFENVHAMLADDFSGFAAFSSAVSETTIM